MKRLLLYSCTLISLWSCSKQGKDDTVKIIYEDQSKVVQNAKAIKDKQPIKIIPGLKIDLWASDSLLQDPVAIAVDDKGAIFVNSTNRNKASEFDIRGHRDWMTESIGFQSVEDRRAFLRRNFSPEHSAKNTWLPDLNGDGSHDWLDLKVEKEEIFKVEDLNGDGYADQSTRVFNGFNEEVTDVAGGLLVRKKDAFVAIGPDLMRLKHNNGQWKNPESISTGYAVHIGFGGHGMSGLTEGPDGKIYNAINFLNLNVIADPNQPGADCDFRLNEVILPIDTCHFGSSVFGLPNNDESFYLTSFIGSACEPIMLTDFNTLDSCPGLPVYFFDISNYYPYSVNLWSWDFGDPDAGPLNFSDLQNPEHIYSENGLYEVTLIAYSDTFSFCKTDTITKMIAINCATVVQNGIDQLNSLDDDVNIYPNPVNDLLYIASDQHIKEVRIFNALGALVFQKNDNFNIEKIELNLANGIYFLELSNENGSTQKKILVNRGI
jgi:hypothetical protein